MEKVLKGIGKTLSTALIVIVVLLALLLVGVRLIGFTPYAVLSGSMEPNYPVGSIVYVKKVDPATLQVGDAITFRLTGNVVATHRIIEVHNEGQLGFRTQGDANETADGVTPATAVVGKVFFGIPFLGYVSNYVQTPMGIVCILGVSAAVLVLSGLIDAVFDKKKKQAPEEPDSGETNG